MNTQTDAQPVPVSIYAPAPDQVGIVWRPCPDCSEDDRARPFVYVHTPWLGGHGTCLVCGTVINGDGAQARGGGVGWRTRNKAQALQAWQRYNTPDHQRQWACPLNG